jgi:ATP-dependent DNA helicase 2 subunit 1
MIKQLASKDKVAVVRFVPRSTSQVRFCALIPQTETFDENNFQTPPGFNLVFLPFSEDIRKLETVKPQSKVEIERNMVVNAKLLIKSLSIDFDCRNFENPDLQTFFSNLQAIALNENDPEEIDDLLEPDVEGMGKYASVVDNFKDIIWTGAYHDPEVGNAGAAPKLAVSKKKKADDGSDLDAPKTKQVKKTAATKEKYDRTDMDDSDDGARKKKVAGGKKGGKGKDAESDGDDYDFNDGFLVDDNYDSKKKKGSKKTKDDDDDGGDDIVTKLQQGEV